MRKSDQGIDHHRYCVIPRTLIFIINETSQVLLIKGAPDKTLWSGLYNGIGGHIEKGENILEAACRELAEETGINNINLLFCGQIMVDVTEKTGVSIFIFKGFYAGEKMKPSHEGTLEWIKLDDLEKLPVVEDLVELLPILVKHRGKQSPLIAKYQMDESGKYNYYFN